MTPMNVRALLCTAVFCFAALFAGVVHAGDAKRCCFTNPRFAGVCSVTPGPEETCTTILAYLNDQTSTGRTYCGNTTVRGGWAQVNCEASTSVGPMCSSAPQADLTRPARFADDVEAPKTTDDHEEGAPEIF